MLGGPDLIKFDLSKKKKSSRVFFQMSEEEGRGTCSSWLGRKQASVLRTAGTEE